MHILENPKTKEIEEAETSSFKVSVNKNGHNKCQGHQKSQVLSSLPYSDMTHIISYTYKESYYDEYVYFLFCNKTAHTHKYVSFRATMPPELCH